MGQTKAVPISMLFADKIFREEGTKKVHIAGVFWAILASRFPICLNFGVYQVFTDMMGQANQTGLMDISYLDGNQEKIAKISSQVTINPDRLGYTELIFNFSNLPIIRPGVLKLSFELNGQEINSRTLKVEQIKTDETRG